jgi:hypothetical protein
MLHRILLGVPYQKENSNLLAVLAFTGQDDSRLFWPGDKRAMPAKDTYIDDPGMLCARIGPQDGQRP